MTASPPRPGRVVPHVLHVAQPLHSGVPIAAAAMLRDQVERGWRVTAASPSDSILRDLAREAGAAWVAWEAQRAPGPSTALETARLARVVARAAPDAVHLHSAKAGVAGRVALRGALPTLFQPHAWSFEAAGRLRPAVVRFERAATRWTDLVVCVSEDERERGRRAGVPARYAVAPNGVDLERYEPADAAEREAARAALGLAVGVPTAVLVGRLQEQKGHDLALAAWARVLEQVPGAVLALVGDGPDRAAIEAAAPGGVVLAGAAGDVRPWLAAADVVLHPSRWEAGLTLVAMEAMARARPVVATATAGMRDGLGEGAGEVVDLGDVEGLARALSARLRDPALAAREGEAARRRVEERYDRRRTAARVAELTAGVIAVRGRRPGA